MTTRYCTPESVVGALSATMPGDRIVLNAGTYSALDSYTATIRGGATWGTRTKIEARVRRGVRDRVVIKGTSADTFALRLAHAMNSNLEFVGIEFDGSEVQASAVKVTNSNSADEAGSAARRIRFTECTIHSSPLSCVLVTSPSLRFSTNDWTVELVNCEVYGAGRPGTVGTSHAVYAPGGSVLVSKSRLHDCTGQGVAFYSAGPEQNGAPLPAGSRIEWSQVWGCGRSGILLAGQGDEAEGNTVINCQIGLHVWPTARGWSEKHNLLSSSWDRDVYVDPKAAAA